MSARWNSGLEWIGRQLFGAALLVLLWQLAAQHATGFDAGTVAPLDRVERVIGKQPKYKSTPQYALLVFGTDAHTKVWLVEDGRTLYVDKNANGDLTDDGPPIEPTNVVERQISSTSFEFDYLLDEIVPLNQPKQIKLRVARWNYGNPTDSYGISVTVDEETPMYAGWFGTIWAANPLDVPLVHFGGPLLPKLLRFKQYAIGGEPKRLSLGFGNMGKGAHADSRLSTEGLPETANPIVKIDWPVAPGAAPIKTTCVLTHRCCYWEFYNPEFQVPPGAVSGVAKATVSIREGKFPFDLVTDQLEFSVLAPGSEVDQQ